MRSLSRTILILVVAALFAAGARAAIVEIAVGPSNSFSPKFPTINVGDTVRWTLMGGSHNVNSDDGLFRSGNVSSSWPPFTHTFNSPGTFGYHCEAHGSPGVAMFGTITVSGGGGGGAPGSLSFTGSASKSVSEGAGNITLTVQRTGGDDGAVSVNYETVNNGTANTPSDYIQTNGTLNWADNDDNNKTFQVPIVDDSDVEGNQTFSVQLVSPGGGASLGSPSVVTVTINDNDSTPGSPGTVRFTSSTATVSESAPNVTLTAERTGGSTGAISVNYATGDGTALTGSDYLATSGTLSWGNGDSANKNFQVPIVGDSVEEPSESFTATLSAPSGGATLGSPSTATVSITDDDITCEPCVADATTLCLAGGSGDPSRFRVRITWTDFSGGSGPAFAVPSTADSGFFYFFDPSNLEMLVKMVRGCGSELNAYWFFYAAATNLGLQTEVLDTTACVTKNYSNPLGNFASDGDIAALPTCP
ncbi:MAG: Calx-beta domain-containing protein [Thermoanaerobaculia bacterium]